MQRANTAKLISSSAFRIYLVTSKSVNFVFGWHVSSWELTKCPHNFYPTYLGTNLGRRRQSVTSVTGNHSLHGTRIKIADWSRPGPARDHLEGTLGYSTWHGGSPRLSPDLNTWQISLLPVNIRRSAHIFLHCSEPYMHSYTITLYNMY